MDTLRFFTGVLYDLMEAMWTMACLVGLVLVAVAIPTSDRELFVQYGFPLLVTAFVLGSINRAIIARWR